jgi:hypothetical protein
MTRFVLASAVLALSAGVAGCNDSPTNPSGGNQQPNPQFRAQLLSANEVPPVTNADAGASGTMNITFNVTRDANGAITAGTVDFTGTFAGFPPGTALTAAHIHTGVAGQNGGVLINVGLSPGEITFANGSGSLTKTGISASVDNINAIIANPAGFYFNAHTAANPGGAVRAQLVRIN